MSERDFVKLYGLDGIREEIQESMSHNNRFEDLGKAFSLATDSQNYNVRRRTENDEVRFSTDCYNERSRAVLLLEANVRYAWSWKRRTWSLLKRPRIVTALRFDTSRYNINYHNIKVDYIQSVSGIMFKQYQDVQDLLGMRPHELLFAHFVARIAPVLDAYPDINVYLSKKRDSNRLIAERFCKKSSYQEFYKLNPNKERVRQIFGAESPWLKANS